MKRCGSSIRICRNTALYRVKMRRRRAQRAVALRCECHFCVIPVGRPARTYARLRSNFCDGFGATQPTIDIVSGRYDCVMLNEVPILAQAHCLSDLNGAKAVVPRATHATTRERHRELLEAKDHAHSDYDEWSL
jgi:hypothetical protein